MLLQIHCAFEDHLAFELALGMCKILNQIR